MMKSISIVLVRDIILADCIIVPRFRKRDRVDRRFFFTIAQLPSVTSLLIRLDPFRDLIFYGFSSRCPFKDGPF
jgi:hypothetical protein